MSGSEPAGRAAPKNERKGRLSVAELREAVPGRMWGGKGCGAACDYCRVVLGSSEVEYEVEVELGGSTLLLHFHPRCHDAWKASTEQARLEDPSIKASDQAG